MRDFSASASTCPEPALRHVCVITGFFVALVALGCAGGAAAQRSSPSSAVPAGSWGGDGIALTVTDAGARLEFDCATGEIPTPLTVDADGRLAVDGVFVREHGGPAREDEAPDRHPARYAGRLEGTTLTLDVTLTDSKQIVGTFTVTRGRAARIRKCL